MMKNCVRYVSPARKCGGVAAHILLYTLCTYIRGNTNNRKTALFPFQNNLQIAWAGE